ncbi:L-lactate permease [Chloroflexota bacterium]
MNSFIDLNLGTWILAILPLVLFSIAILCRLSLLYATAISLVTATLTSFFMYGADVQFLTVVYTKGLSLTLFVALILWSALLLYNLMSRLGSVDTIGYCLTKISRSQMGQALLLGWAFSGFIEGVTGFGIPVAIVAPLMLMAGFSPIVAAASVLVGHSWAVTFGSMGSAFYTLQLVTDIPSASILIRMSLMFILPIFVTGLLVCHIQGGWSGLLKGLPTVLIAGSAMVLLMLLMAIMGIPQLAAIVPGIGGCGVIWIIAKTPLLPTDTDYLRNSWKAVDAQKNIPSVYLSFLPYFLLISLTLVSQIPIIKQATSGLHFAFNFPRLETSLGYIVEPVTHYAEIGLISHPAALIFLSIAVTSMVFYINGRWQRGTFSSAIKATSRQCAKPILGITFIIVMALIMNSTGMTQVIAAGIVETTGNVYPLFSPFVGFFGCFLTGSNTNSNVIFGALQVEAARSLGMNMVTIASAQSIGGSLASAVAPAKVLIGATTVGLGGNERILIRKTIGYSLLVTLLVGLESLGLIYLTKA